MSYLTIKPLDVNPHYRRIYAKSSGVKTPELFCNGLLFLSLNSFLTLHVTFCNAICNVTCNAACNGM